MMIKIEPRESCRLCSIKPKFYTPKEYDPYESRVILAEGVWSGLYFGVKEDGTLFMLAAGEDESDYYYPKFCPECGRRLIKVGS